MALHKSDYKSEIVCPVVTKLAFFGTHSQDVFHSNVKCFYGVKRYELAIIACGYIFFLHLMSFSLQQLLLQSSVDHLFLNHLVTLMFSARQKRSHSYDYQVHQYTLDPSVLL